MGETPYMHEIPDPGLPKSSVKPCEPGLLDALRDSFTPDFSRYRDCDRSLCEAIAEEVGVNFGASASLQPVTQENADGKEESFHKILYTSTLSFNSFSPYYARFTFFRYQEPDFQQGYEPDFSYSFGAANYAPGSFSLEYANYGGNRLNPEKGEEVTDFLGGTVSFTYRDMIPRRLTELFLPPHRADVGGWVSVNVTPEYQEGEYGKVVVSYGFSLPVWKQISFWCLGNIYPLTYQETSGDPDFVYGFGYYDWFGGGWIFSYSNYAPNAYPWSEKTGDFWEGSVFIGYNLDIAGFCKRFRKGRCKPDPPSRTRYPWGPPFPWGN